jgi:hypothetical protein
MALPKLEVQTYNTKLPSTGQTVIYRPFLVKEHKILLTLLDSDNEEIARVVKNLVDACTFNKLDIEKLASFDIEFLFLLLRARSIGENMDLILTCKNCEHKNEVTVNLLNAKIEKTEGHSNIIKITDNISIVMKYPKIDDSFRYFQNTNTDEIFDFVLSSIETIINDDETYDTKEQTKEELTEFVNSMSKEQFDRLENFFVSMPKLTQEVVKVCSNCNYENKILLEGLENFFV